MAVAAVDTVAADARVAMVAGATGLVGREVLAALLADKTYRTVHVLGRRKLPPDLPESAHPKLVQHIVDFAALSGVPKVDDVYIALGTTIQVAGSQAAFRAVDYDAVLAVALAAYAQGATNLGVVSAMGADATSKIFYSKVKGEIEHALVRAGFKSVSFVRPSMLAGDRASLQQHSRAGERIGLAVSQLFKPLIPANYRAVLARDVAYGLIKAVKSGTPGVQTILSGDLQGAAP
jgi:uncharacterized protein YbjT (DUF2867 family)